MKTFNLKNKISQDKQAKKAPKFYVLRIYLLSIFLYFMLVIPFFVITNFKSLITFLNKTNKELYVTNSSNDSQSTFSVYTIPADSLHLGKTDLERDVLNGETAGIDLNAPGAANLKKIKKQKSTADKKKHEIGSGLENIFMSFKIFLILMLIAYIFNYPFKSYFRKKRKSKRITKAHYNFVRRFCIVNPIINASILGLGFLILNIDYLYQLYTSPHLFVQSPWFQKTAYISIIASLLAVIFIYFWEKHRLHIRYIEHIYSPVELRKNIFKYRLGKIKSRLWISSLMTSILPLSLVALYLFISPTRLSQKDYNQLTTEQKELIFPQGISQDDETPNIQDFEESDDGYFFYNYMDSIFMTIGITLGIITSFIYIFFFMRWTTKDIIIPVSALLDQVHKMGRGNLDSYGAVRTNDEIGELTQGFNEMTDKLNEYFQGIQRINEANSRFVPKQFLEFLGKERIDEINLGDQVQKEMTVMFSDIREFTNISERMSPKENFDFLNNYLGVMEPVIHAHKGFIDKFIGDAIMALFSDDVDSAIDAAVDMRFKLFEFNTILKQYGRDSIDSGIGIHTGNLMLGIVGGEERMDGTVISDAVNLSARLEGLTKKYGVSIILSEDTVMKIKNKDRYHLRCIDLVKVKGKNEAVKIFEVLNGEPKKQRKLKIDTLSKFNACIDLYKKGDFDESLVGFQELEKKNQHDKVIQIYIQRCTRYLNLGTPENWDGIEVLDSK